jgi:hypothetical protein
VNDNDSDADRTVVGIWYANSFEVGQNAFEFKVDCGQDRPDDEVVTVYLRIIANPSNARQLFRLLGVGLIRYADTFGPIGEEPRHEVRRGEP